MGLFSKKTTTEGGFVLLLGGHSVTVKGESHHLATFERFLGPRSEAGMNEEVVLELIQETDNPYDPNAIMVCFPGPGLHSDRQLGYMDRAAAEAFRPVAERLSAAGLIGRVNATIRGGWDRGRGEAGDFGVVLDLASPEACTPSGAC